MTTAPGGAPGRPEPAVPAHPLRTIRDIRDSLPADQARHFDAELADTELEALPEMLSRWVRLATDGFEEFLLSRPFEGLEFGARSYDDDQAGDQ
ncbi:hypothetical protein VSR01_09220 [Actinacidiphila sp. DG2A-62]|jgi:hypothetical protein|uniref:hypothetical protein n=1 Tax=Actinacidiphila sp. DG2A-62 TaxID=3108821 RepID=UPI002DBB2018|nr:hypothetical protein [Actinacidiphila sp. DG2A-62]MEC3993704.1 hypothetical protein [Actinacidiphila sp. DG2A-62]